MNLQDFDKLIDAAAQDMVSRQPSDSLTYKVMTRVRGRVDRAPRRVMWAVGLAGAVVVCVAVAVVMLNQGSAPAPQLQRLTILQARAVEPRVASQPAVEPMTPHIEIRQLLKRPTALSGPPSIAEAPVLSSLEPLTTDPIVVSALEVRALDSQTPSIKDIEIEDITIEPLAASND